MPPGLQKRWAGFGFDRCLRAPGNLNYLSPAAKARLRHCLGRIQIVPVPKENGVGLIFFASVAEAMQATVELLDLQPAAIEHLDRVLSISTKGQLFFKAARDLLELDAKPCESILIVEFFCDVEESSPLSRRRILACGRQF